MYDSNLWYAKGRHLSLFGKVQSDIGENRQIGQLETSDYDNTVYLTSKRDITLFLKQNASDEPCYKIYDQNDLDQGIPESE
jgi:hypothetical protein